MNLGINIVAETLHVKCCLSLNARLIVNPPSPPVLNERLSLCSGKKLHPFMTSTKR